MLRVTSIPRPPQLDAVVRAVGETSWSPIAELTGPQLLPRAGRWRPRPGPDVGDDRAGRRADAAEEDGGAVGDGALAACAARGEPVTDAFGRRLRLQRRRAICAR
ncbi:MAG: hypothetical protein HS111_21625 [Kofleriaceae bacterium]|nr:hypothetical protein [Kofleriaceae bacterium]